MIAVDIVSESALEIPEQIQAQPLLELVYGNEGINSAKIALVFTDDEYLSELKKQFFQVDQLTDVIAFRLNEYSEPEPEGEIYISLERARENAGKFNVSFIQEVARLIIHGGLHLIGYDDESPIEKEKMNNKEDEYLKRWNELD